MPNTQEGNKPGQSGSQGSQSGMQNPGGESGQGGMQSPGKGQFDKDRSASSDEAKKEDRSTGEAFPGDK